MAYNYYDGRQPQYYYYPSDSSELSRATFREPSSNYLDDNYRHNYSRQNSDHSRHSLIPMEQVFGREDAGVPWWLNRDYPHGGHDGYHLPLQAHHHPWQHNDRQDQSRPHDHSTMVEMYVPLCCDECERKVRKHLKDMEGVESVSADQWAKKVVVVGYNLHPHFLLRRMQRDKPDSVFWSDRPQ